MQSIPSALPKASPRRDQPTAELAFAIETGRLILRPLTTPLATAVLAGSFSLTVAASWPDPEFVARTRLAVIAGGQLPASWLIIRRSDSMVIGDCGWRAGPDRNGSVEIGYHLVAAARRRGYGTEAVGALLTRTLATPGVSRVAAAVEVGNLASRQLLLRLGFRPERAGEGHEHYVIDVCGPGCSPER